MLIAVFVNTIFINTFFAFVRFGNVREWNDLGFIFVIKQKQEILFTSNPTNVCKEFEKLQTSNERFDIWFRADKPKKKCQRSLNKLIFNRKLWRERKTYEQPSCEFQHLKMKLYPYPACIVRSKSGKKVQLNASRLPFCFVPKQNWITIDRWIRWMCDLRSWCSPIWIKHNWRSSYAMHKIKGNFTRWASSLASNNFCTNATIWRRTHLLNYVLIK